MTEQQLHEFRSLRDAVASRGQLRVGLTVAGLWMWAMVLTALVIAPPYPVAAIVPLTVLLVTFEAIRPLHFGAERIGRYLQVFYEEANLANAVPDAPLTPPAWERTAMAFGAAVPGAAGHPLFAPTFAAGVGSSAFRHASQARAKTSQTRANFSARRGQSSALKGSPSALITSGLSGEWSG